MSTESYVPSITGNGNVISQERLDKITKKFADVYGEEPDFFVRAPGRVNLIGEHIDYSGYSVVPMAIGRDTIIAVKINQSPNISVCNYESDKFAPHTFEKLNVAIDNKNHSWINYFLCGYRGILENVPELNLALNQKNADKITGFSAMVQGTVPLGSGLSSSSALVCASALATLRANKSMSCLTKSELARITATSEQYMGLQSGGMDQAISFLGQLHNASKIDFNPIKATPVSLPLSAVFYVANSMVESNKYHTADTCYNMRVVECKLAAALLSKRLELASSSIKILKDVQIAGNYTLGQMIDYVQRFLHPEPYSREELMKELDMDAQQLVSHFIGDQIQSNAFYLFQRALHVYSESQLVELFVETACNPDLNDEEKISKLGNLMNMSHESCDKNFNCSCPELDELTSICRESGATGSRLTGAGWGGCVISIVPIGKSSEFCEKVSKSYFSKFKGIDIGQVLFSTSPSQGATVHETD